MTKTVTIQKEVEMLKRAMGCKPEIIITMWCPDRGDGKPGFARFNSRNPEKKTPVYELER